MRTGGKILIDQLVGEGCSTLFTVPGESFIAALDALFDAASIRTIVCRHEGGAAMMAEATGKLTGDAGRRFRHARAGRHERRERGVSWRTTTQRRWCCSSG